MPVFIISILIQVALVAHVIKTGRNTLWIWALIFLPLAGSLAYFAIEILPELVGGRAGRRVVSSAKRTIDPAGDLRRAQRQLRANDSIENRRRVANELCSRGHYVQAIDYYRQALTGLYEHDPYLLLGMANAQFLSGDAAGARATLDRLREHNPDFKSAEGHLLYARALEGEGNLDKAREEFAAVAVYYPGAEARYRYASLLARMGQGSLARDVLTQLLTDAEFATKYFRREQREWLTAAKRELQSL